MKKAIKMLSILDFNLVQLKEIFKEKEIPSFRAQQIFDWVYKKGVFDFDKMANLPLDLRNKLKEDFYPAAVGLKEKHKSQDGTEKFLFKLNNNQFVESVFIPAKNRATVCLSSQAGCKFSCSFCASGLAGFKRNLSCAEIISQLLFIKQMHRNINNIVFMGMGEPLDNYDNVMKAVRVINEPEGLGIGARKITISTCGLIPQIEKLAKEGMQFELSVSLHTADNKIRDSLMPINKKYPLEKLILTCKEYIKKTDRQITFEYVLMSGVNSSTADAFKLSRLLKGMNCKVNLIPFNQIQNLKFKAPSAKEVDSFSNELIKQKINVTIRKSRGHDIDASCGELRLRKMQYEQ